MVERNVVLLHGLFRTRYSLRKLERALKEAGYNVWNRGYPSTRRSLEEHAEELGRELELRFGGQPDASLDFVTHSLGGIVVRAYLAKQRERLPVRRVVMLAPPNQGAQIVDLLKGLWLYRLVAGTVGQQLARDDSGPGEIFGLYPVPEDVEVGIVAGGKGEDEGYAPWLAGDNDGTVSVASTALKGAKDHILVPHIHTFIMNAPESIANVLHFLERGRFLPAAQRVELQGASELS